MNVPDDAGLAQGLGRAEGLAQAAGAFALTLEELGAIELPPAHAQADSAQLRALAALYLVAELDAAGVIEAAESLVRVARSGALVLDFGGAAPALQAFWQSRADRLAREEREALFWRLFGTSGAVTDAQAAQASGFVPAMIDLCEALYRLEERSGLAAQQARLRSAALRLLDELLAASNRVTVFVAQELLATLRQALGLLGHAGVKAAFGARTLWQVIDRIDRLMRVPSRPHALHARRGQAGMTVIAWLAAQPDGGLAAAALPDAAVVGAAVDWLEASLALTERSAPATTAPSSDWAALTA